MTRDKTKKESTGEPSWLEAGPCLVSAGTVSGATAGTRTSSARAGTRRGSCPGWSPAALQWQSQLRVDGVTLCLASLSRWMTCSPLCSRVSSSRDLPLPVWPLTSNIRHLGEQQDDVVMERRHEQMSMWFLSHRDLSKVSSLSGSVTRVTPSLTSFLYSFQPPWRKAVCCKLSESSVCCSVQCAVCSVQCAGSSVCSVQCMQCAAGLLLQNL